jgi:hypothetical protein
MKLSISALAVLALCASGCEPPAASSGTSAAPPSSAPAPSQTASAAAPPDDAAWLLAGSNDERFARVAKHLRGFDMAMVETNHRYAELYWAGKDRNWEYAEYQIKKIQTAVANGAERRPKRAKSAEMLDAAVLAVKDAIAKREPAAFDKAFGVLTDTCNACHQAEKMPFIRVAPPPVRTSWLVAPAEPPP